MAKKKSKSKADVVGGLFFVGALIIGLGFGIFYANAAAGVLLGLGAGFILYGLIKAFMKG